jgi:hypothetical protein
LNEKTIEKKPRITTAIVETNKPSLSSLTNSLKCSFTLKIKRGHSANQRHIMIQATNNAILRVSLSLYSSTPF